MALIGEIHVALLVPEGACDDIVPPAVSRRLFEAEPNATERYPATCCCPAPAQPAERFCHDGM